MKKPWQELAGFAKTGVIEPGTSEKVVISFDTAGIASYDEKRQAYALEAGEYIVRAGNNSADTQSVAALTLAEDVIVRKVRSVSGAPGFKEAGYERTVRCEDIHDLPTRICLLLFMK